MPKYLIEGKTVVTETPLSEDEIDEIASSIKPSMPVAKPSAEPTQEELLAASQPSFRTATSGIGRRYSEPSPELARQVGLFGRAAYEGLTAPATITLEGLRSAYNLGAGLTGSTSRLPSVAEAQSQMLTKTGFPEPQGMLERAVQTGTQAMTGTGVLAGLAPKVPALAANLAQQIPASGMAGLVAQPTAEVTKEATSGVLGEQGSDLAALIASIGIGAKVGAKTAGGVGKLIGEKAPPIYTMDEVRQNATRSYNAMDEAGVAIKPQSALGMVDKVKSALEDARLIQGSDEAKALNTRLDAIQTMIGTERVPFRNLEKMRSMLNDLKTNPNPEIKRFGSIAVNNVDDYISSLNGRDVIAGKDGLDKAVSSVMSARKDWRNQSRAEVLQDALDVVDAKLADPKASESELIRRGFINISSNKSKMRLFSDTEQNVIKSVAKGGSLDPILSVMGSFSPFRSKLATGATLVAGIANPAVAVGMASSGYLADTLQSRLRRRAAELAVKQIASGATPSQQPNFGYSGLLGTTLANPQPQE
jgi:hypothetical protein